MNKQFLSLAVSLLLLVTVLPVLGKQPTSTVTTGLINTSPPMKTGGDDDWPMFRHDPAHSGYSQSQAPHTGAILWNRTVGSSAASSPIATADRVYISSFDGYVHCLDAQTGTTIWISPYLGTPLECDSAIANGKLYISANKLYCFNASNGNQLWNKSDGANGRSPTITNEKVYIGADKIYCFNATSGSMIWNFSNGNSSSFSSPAIANDTLFVGEETNAQLYFFNASTGKLNRNISLNPYGRFTTTPAIVNRRVYLGTQNGWILCFNATNGNLTWGQLIGDQVRSSPAITGTHIYFGCNDTFVYCYNALTGVFIWSAQTGGPVNSSPIVADGKVFISSDKFYSLDALTGSELWTVATGGGVSSPAIAHDKVFVSGNTNNVYCFKDPNGPPDVPRQPVGPTAAGHGIVLNFSTVTTDHDGDQVYYMWNWSDGNNSDWLGPFDSNESITVNHTWGTNGTYPLRVKAKDTLGNQSNWSQPLVISIARQINLSNIQIGYVYIKIFSFNSSFIYIDLLRSLGVAVIITNHDLFVQADATEAVHTVVFVVYSPSLNDSMVRVDDNGSNGFSCSFNVTWGMYELRLTAFDANGTLIDRQNFSSVIFLHFGSHSLPPSGQLRHIAREHRLRH
jgi:outer membrane protein assembly factor BamB